MFLSLPSSLSIKQWKKMSLGEDKKNKNKIIIEEIPMERKQENIVQ